jgi:hypothetical protein
MPKNSNIHQAPQFLETAVSGIILLTENRFRNFMSEFPNASESYNNGIKIVHYEFWRQIDNNFNLSYHLKFPQKNVQFNFWFDKISYLNSKESVSISFWNGNEKFEKDRLKKILTTTFFNELKKKVDELFIQYS